MKQKLQAIIKPTVVVLAGATSSGKTAIAKELYSTNAFEVISADSRQLYKGLDIGTGKDKSFPQAMIDVANPSDAQTWSVGRYRDDALPLINEIIAKNRIPLIVGGTGFYIESLIFKQSISDARTSPEVRREIEKLSNEKLIEEIKHQDSRTYKTIDRNNRVRLLRAVEILRLTKKPIAPINRTLRDEYDIHIFVIDVPRDWLYKSIDVRVDERLKQGMVEEVESLIKSGVSAEWLISLGLEYRYITQYLLNRSSEFQNLKLKIKNSHALNFFPSEESISYDHMVTRLKYAIHAYARRQITFFKRWPNATWADPDVIISKIKGES